MISARKSVWCVVVVQNVVGENHCSLPPRTTSIHLYSERAQDISNTQLTRQYNNPIRTLSYEIIAEQTATLHSMLFKGVLELKAHSTHRITPYTPNESYNALTKRVQTGTLYISKNCFLAPKALQPHVTRAGYLC